MARSCHRRQTGLPLRCVAPHHGLERVEAGARAVSIDRVPTALYLTTGRISLPHTSATPITVEPILGGLPVHPVVWEHTFVSEYRYTVAEYDPHRPWLLIGEISHLTVELDDEHNFSSWAARRWPAPRFRAELDPGQLSPWQRPG